MGDKKKYSGYNTLVDIFGKIKKYTSKYSEIFNISYEEYLQRKEYYDSVNALIICGIENGNIVINGSEKNVNEFLNEIYNEMHNVSQIEIVKNTKDWSSNNIQVEQCANMVHVSGYVQGTPVNGKSIASGLPKPLVHKYLAFGSPSSTLALTQSGALGVVISGNTSSQYIGVNFSYFTNDEIVKGE